MQISKLSVTVCATALCWSVAWVQAADETPAQAAAIAALRQKAAAEDSATSQAPTASAVTPTAQPEVTPAQAAAIAALRQKAQSEENTGGTASAPPVLVDSSGEVSPRDAAADAAQAKAVAEAQEAARQRALAVQAEAQRKEQIAIMKAKMAAEVQAEQAAKAQAAADEKAALEAAQAKAAADAAAKNAAAAQAAAQKQADEQAAAQAKAKADAAAAAYYPGKELGFKPVQAAASPISPEKQAQLDSLLVKYQANQISPEAYHTQRAAILAQP